ncbi:MAG: hypothetical protein ACYDGN_17970 [Acidimicrobiales bacterium]
MESGFEMARLLRAAATGALHFLTHGDASTELAARETEFHHGDDPIQADIEAHQHFEEAARDTRGFDALSILAIVGEEKIANIPPHRAGDRVIVVDPLDGSKPWAIARIGYCVAAIQLRALDPVHYEVETAIIATPTEAFTLIDGLLRHGPLNGEPETDLVVASVVPETPVISRTWAAVAYKPEDRPDAMRILEQLPNWSFISLGGNPLTPYVLTARLTAAVTLKPTSTWDSVGTLMASATDAFIGDHHGNQLSGPDFTALFAQVLLEHANVAAIPKLIVAKSEDAYREIVAAIARARLR